MATQPIRHHLQSQEAARCHENRDFLSTWVRSKLLLTNSRTNSRLKSELKLMLDLKHSVKSWHNWLKTEERIERKPQLELRPRLSEHYLSQPNPAMRLKLLNPSMVDHKTTRILCDKFSGSQSKVSVTQWLTIFEIVTFEYSNREKLLALTRHLSDEAFSWFAMEISPRMATITWSECRLLMLKRFDQFVTNRIIEASERRSHSKETVLSYYNDTRRLMAETGASPAIQVEMLTKGISESYRPLIASHKPKTPEDWIEMALVIEVTKCKFLNRPQDYVHCMRDDDTESESGRVSVPKPDSKWIDFSKPPKTPCPRCLPSKQMHWKRFCPYLSSDPDDT